MTRVLVADDCPIIRLGLCEVLKRIAGAVVTAEAGTGPEILNIFSHQQIELLILDLWLKGDYFAGGLEQIKKEHPKTRVVVFAARPEEELGVLAIHAGADAFVSKELGSDELLQAVRKVLAGRKHLSAALEARLLGDGRSAAFRPTAARLSRREYQVSRGLIDGQTQKAIAGRLGISIKSIGTYRTRLMNKLHLSNNAQLVVYAKRRAGE